MEASKNKNKVDIEALKRSRKIHKKGMQGEVVLKEDELKEKNNDRDSKV